MPMNMKGPILFDNLDVPNNKPAPSVKHDYLWVVYIVIAFLVAVFIGIILFIARMDWVYQNSLNDQERLLAVFLTYAIPVSIFIALIGVGIGAARFVWLKGNREKLINLWESQSTIKNLEKGTYEQTIIENTLTAVLERMKQSQYAGIQTLTLDQSRQITNALPEPTLEEEIHATNDEPLPALQELKARNMINRSGNSLLLGFTQEEIE